MFKKIFFSFMITTLVLSSSLLGFSSKASFDYKGELIKMDGLSAVYYVASDGKRYVFPNAKIYKSWFNNFDDVLTISREEMGNIVLGGNVLYRPGVLLIKTVTNSNVYAVSQNGVLRSIKTEANARTLYGENWNRLIDDVPDSFFTNYTIGAEIDNASDFNLDEEMRKANSIDANFGLSIANAKQARTTKCQFLNQSRACASNDNNDNNTEYSNNGEAPYIEKISVSNSGNSEEINVNDKISINFSEAIDPTSIHPDLKAGSYINSLAYDVTGSINIYHDGVFEIKDIASFDIGVVENSGRFSVKMELNSNSETLNITLIAGEAVQINDEDFEDAKQIADTIKDMTGDFMEFDSDIGKPSGTFGGENVNDGIEPYITSIKVNNNGSKDYIDTGDEIRVTFSEAIDPESINNDLDEDASVHNVESNETGGIRINDNGILTITDIASFFVGSVNDDRNFEVSLALNIAGDTLTITLTNGSELALDNEDLDDAKQIGDTVEDKDGNEMDDDPNISDPSGTFIGDSTGTDLYIDFIKAYDGGYSGYLDVNDRLVITFSEAIDPEYVETGVTLEFDETGGAYVDSEGILTITDILSFDIGEVEEAERFETNLSLSSSNKVLTVTLVNGEALKINQEIFSNTKQLGGYIINAEDNSVVMASKNDISDPSGTFGGDSTDTAPYITEIEVSNGNDSGYIDVNDKIVITFNEAIDPESIDNDLELDGYIDNVDDDDTGGVRIQSDGKLTITDIAEFYIGDVSDDSQFDVRLSLNSIGNILSITLKSGEAVEIIYEDLDNCEQIGGTIEDESQKTMEDDPRIDDPNGTF